MIQPRIKIPKVEFYITNVCNLTCEDCNRFNNFDFRGWQAWQTYEHIYQEWAKYVELDQIVILGGEPLLNPTVIEWARGLEKIWGKYVQILTNGTRINHVRGLYELISTTYNWIGISLHDQNYFPEFEQELHKFLTPPIYKFHRGHQLCKHSNSDVEFIDGKGVQIPVWLQDEFVPGAIQMQPNGRYTLHSNDPEKAHAICPIAQNKSYHFIHGKLYKCGPVALFPEFDQQHEFDISESDRELVYHYQPLTLDDFPRRGKSFLDNIDNPIPQCKFCSVIDTSRKIISIRKGRNDL